MATDFPFVKIPVKLVNVVGEPDEGTRVFRQYGTDRECAVWWELLHDIDKRFVSPGGVGMFAGASRAAVHKRLKEGRLTAFCFHITEQTQNWFGRKKRKVKATPFVYIPVSECKAWGQELQARAQQLLADDAKEAEERLRRELEGPKPDWMGGIFDLQKNVDDRVMAEKEVREDWRKLETRGQKVDRRLERFQNRKKGKTS